MFPWKGIILEDPKHHYEYEWRVENVYKVGTEVWPYVVFHKCTHQDIEETSALLIDEEINIS